MPIAHATAMFRISKVRECGGYDEEAKRAEDFALCYKLRHTKIIALKETLTFYRKTSPTPLRYIVESGRSSRIVKKKIKRGSWASLDEDTGLPRSLLVDTRSYLQWISQPLLHKYKTLQSKWNLTR
jgi:hypothetical protein